MILLLHGMTSATIDMTFASGPAAAATSGIAVEAIHQDWGSSSSGGLMWKLLLKRSHRDGCTSRSPPGVCCGGYPFCMVCAAQPCAGSGGDGGCGRCEGSEDSRNDIGSQLGMSEVQKGYDMEAKYRSDIGGDAPSFS